MSDIIDGTVADEGALVALDTASFNLPAPTEFTEKLEGEFAKVYNKIEVSIKDFEYDLSTKASRDRIASFAHRIAKVKVGMASEAKNLVASQKAIIAAVTGSRQGMEEKLSALKDLARKPLTDWEATVKIMEEKATAARKMFMQVRILKHEGRTLDDMTASQAEAFGGFMLAMSFHADEYGADSIEKLVELQVGALDLVDAAVDSKKQAEADAAELEELRQMKAEKLEREAQEQADAEQKAEQDAAAKTRIDGMEGFAAKWTVDMVPIGDCSAEIIRREFSRVEDEEYDANDLGPHNIPAIERQRAGTMALLKHMLDHAIKREIEAEKKASEEREKAEAIRLEQIQKDAAEKAEQDVRDKVDQDRKDEAQRVETERKAEAKQVEAERRLASDRLEAYQEDHDREKAMVARHNANVERIKREDAAEAKRRADDTKHRGEVNTKALRQIEAYSKEKDFLFNEEVAKTVIRAVVAGRVDRMKMEY